MNFEQIQKATQAEGLDVIGFVDDQILLLGPSAEFWEIFEGSPEYLDEKPDPVDRWSLRVIRNLAELFGATAEFPFGGPPYAPFLDWALKSGWAWQSPVGMLVHDQMGLMVSYRGALRFDERLELPPTTSEKPCDTCVDQPCLTACPVNALTPQGYDTDACATHLRTKEGAACMNGCLVRRACPYSAGAARKTAQSHHHMRAFLEAR